ncbi:hypothetical protein [Nocardia yunnanensis]|uniref:hypothetical protein n=1 Tax=Nocardia yunnanensis TaxID=2382165 RepID=UPI001FE5217F|nr:hypothetical protein [Nocardia yunnanensis]
MTTTHTRPGHPDENLGEFAEELRLLAEAVLERVEPVLRRTASDGRTEWASCSWCPVCAAAAIVRGEHHDVVAAIAEHGTAIVTVLREALAGVPVEPVIPPELDPDSPEYHAWHRHMSAAASAFADRPFADAYAAARGDAEPAGAGESNGAGETSWAAQESASASRTHAPGAGLAAVFTRFLAGAQGRAATRNQHGGNASGAQHGTAAAQGSAAAAHDGAAAPREDAAVPRDGAAGSHDRAPGARRAKYTPIDVTIKG